MGKTSDEHHRDPHEAIWWRKGYELKYRGRRRENWYVQVK